MNYNNGNLRKIIINMNNFIYHVDHMSKNKVISMATTSFLSSSVNYPLLVKLGLQDRGVSLRSPKDYDGVKFDTPYHDPTGTGSCLLYAMQTLLNLDDERIIELHKEIFGFNNSEEGSLPILQLYNFLSPFNLGFSLISAQILILPIILNGHCIVF